jgi:hypothetical protein
MKVSLVEVSRQEDLHHEETAEIVRDFEKNLLHELVDKLDYQIQQQIDELLLGSLLRLLLYAEVPPDEPIYLVELWNGLPPFCHLEKSSHHLDDPYFFPFLIEHLICFSHLYLHKKSVFTKKSVSYKMAVSS